MKKILFFYFIVLSANSQTSMHNLLKSLNGVSETNISKPNRLKFYLGQDELSKLNSNKVIELYKNSSTKPEICMIPINISPEFHVYVEIPTFVFEEKKNVVTFSIFGSYLIFDKKRNVLYRIDSDVACGSVYKKNRKILVINSSFRDLMESVFILDNNLKNIKIANGNIAN